MIEGVAPAAKPADGAAKGGVKAIAIGASAGAVEALSTILPVLPASYPLPIFIVVHLPPHDKSTMADLFRSKCKIRVQEAEDKAPIEPGAVYFAPADYHLLIETDFRLSLSNEEQVLFCRPAVDVLFESAADAYGPGLVGIVLTGANSDGAKGVRRIVERGGVGIAQSPDTAYATAMPRSALAACSAVRSMTLTEIASYLLEAA